jgi:hypothetical protein
MLFNFSSPHAYTTGGGWCGGGGGGNIPGDGDSVRVHACMEIELDEGWLGFAGPFKFNLRSCALTIPQR